MGIRKHKKQNNESSIVINQLNDETEKTPSTSN